MASEKNTTTVGVVPLDNGVISPRRSEPHEKGPAETTVLAALEDVTPKSQDFPLSWKITALTCGVALSWGSSFSENTLGPLKKTLVKELEINNSQYGAISSATSLVNTVLPIIGGYGLDFYGVEWGSLVCAIAIFIGAVISAAGSNQDSFGLVVAGRVIMGFGSTIIETCTSKILAHWFQHRGLGLVYGLDLAVGKLIVLAARATAVPMRDASSFWGWALWIPAIVCCANLIQTIVYFWWARSRPTWAQMPTGRSLAKEAQANLDNTQPDTNITAGTLTRSTTSQSKITRHVLLPNWRALAHVPRFFWLVTCSQILQAGVVGTFNSLSADIITTTRGSTEQIAGYTSAVQQVIPIICAPLLGSFFDIFGHRMLFVSLTSVIWVLVYCLIGLTKTHALGAMVVASVAQTMNALPFLASIPLIVPSQMELGLVLGIWKAFNNSGSVVVDMIAGRLQDITPGGTYERVIAFFVALKGLEFCLGLFYGILDRRYLAGILSISEKKRLVAEREGAIGDPIGRKPAKVFTVVGLSLMGSLIVTAWVLFIRYSI